MASNATILAQGCLGSSDALTCQYVRKWHEHQAPPADLCDVLAGCIKEIRNLGGELFKRIRVRCLWWRMVRIIAQLNAGNWIHTRTVHFVGSPRVASLNFFSTFEAWLSNLNFHFHQTSKKNARQIMAVSEAARTDLSPAWSAFSNSSAKHIFRIYYTFQFESRQLERSL